MEGSLGTFGDLVAFIIPGLVLLIGFSQLSPTVHEYFLRFRREPTTLGGAVLLVVFALGAGLLIEVLRVYTVEPLHHLTGLQPPEWNLSDFTDAQFARFEKAVENYYQFSQFYGNCFIALALGYAATLIKRGARWWRAGWPDAGLVVLMALTWLGSRTDLESFYESIREFAAK